MMAVSHTAQELIQERFHDSTFESTLAYIQVFFQILVEVLKHKGEFALGVHNIKQPNNVRMLQLFEQGYLADRRGRDSLILCLQADLLKSDNLTRHLVLRLVHDTICALTNLFELLV